MAEREPNNPAVQWPCGQSLLHQRCQPKASPRSKMVPHLWPWSSPRSSSSVSTILSISGTEIQTHLRVKGPDSTKPKCSFIKLQLKTGMSSFQLVNRKLWPQKTSLRSELHSEYKIKVREARCYKKYFHQTVVHVISFCSSLSRAFYPVHEHFSTDSSSLTDSFPCLPLFSVASQLSESSSQNCRFIVSLGVEPVPGLVALPHMTLWFYDISDSFSSWPISPSPSPGLPGLCPLVPLSSHY